MALHDSIQVSDFERIIVPSRRRFLLGASATALALAGASSIMAEEPGSQQVSDTPATVIKQEDADHIYASRE